MRRPVSSVILVLALLGGASALAAQQPATNAATLPDRPAQNPCLDARLAQLEARPSAMLSDAESREMTQLEQNCAAYRMTQGRPKDSTAVASTFITRPDYRGEVLPWIAGVGAFMGAILLFLRPAGH